MGRVRQGQKEFVEQLFEQGLKTGKIMDSLKEKFGKNAKSRTTVDRWLSDCRALEKADILAENAVVCGSELAIHAPLLNVCKKDGTDDVKESLVVQQRRMSLAAWSTLCLALGGAEERYRSHLELEQISYDIIKKISTKVLQADELSNQDLTLLALATQLKKTEQSGMQALCRMVEKQDLGKLFAQGPCKTLGSLPVETLRQIHKILKDDEGPINEE